ncbi:helix-turn-helix transcriptional regulator [uncultured Psychroserpens sp.]|nr:helix-turn-helix transcriptional regulator [uncultured Psychroserpens sp.]
MNIIKNIREESGYTQTELAKQSGLSLRTYSV